MILGNMSMHTCYDINLVDTEGHMLYWDGGRTGGIIQGTASKVGTITILAANIVQMQGE